MSTMTSEVAIKKNFVELVELLQNNKDKKVSSILDEVLELVTSKKRETTVRYNDDGIPKEIFCWYHKEWEPVDWYGTKKSSHTGYNTMCKVGVNQWTTQQAEAKKAKAKVLEDVAEGEIKPEEIQTELEKIEAQRQEILPRELYLEEQARKAQEKLEAEAKTKEKKKK